MYWLSKPNCNSALNILYCLDLEDVLTLQTKLYRCAHIFLGKCLPPVTSRRNPLLREDANKGHSRTNQFVQRQNSFVQRQPNFVQRQFSFVQRQSSFVLRQTNCVERQTDFVQRQSSFVLSQTNFVQRQSSFVLRQTNCVWRHPNIHLYLHWGSTEA